MIPYFHSSFCAVFAFRCFALTENGYIGWVPNESREGDNVVLLSGGKVPYVLRPVDHMADTTSDIDFDTIGQPPKTRTFTFVGDAYIHGAMHGECYDMHKLERFRLI